MSGWQMLLVVYVCVAIWIGMDEVTDRHRRGFADWRCWLVTLGWPVIIGWLVAYMLFLAARIFAGLVWTVMRIRL